MAEKHGLTKRQRECLDFVDGYIKKHGYSPSYDDIGKALGFPSKSQIHTILARLEKRGWITRLPGQARSIRLVDQVA